MASSEADAAAVDAVIDHHTQLAAALTAHVAMLLDAARPAADRAIAATRGELVEFCDTQLLPHAAAEERALYPAAGARTEARLLVEAMIAEHRVLERLVDELRESSDAVGSVAAANALLVLFEVHLAKENELLLPLVAADPSVSLADILSGMHELLGDAPHSAHASEAAPTGGCGGACGCGGTDEAEPTLDVRPVPHAIRHATVFGALDAVPPGGTLQLVAPHDPLPLLAQIEDASPGVFTVAYEDRGPDAWRLRLTRSL
jgi:uncharacterized protein (DUF2249 family)